jgi:sulfur-oxidizing protein SoxZ
LATARALITAPASAKPGEIIEIRAVAQHPMETGYRLSGDGLPLARDLVRRVEARFEGELVFAADLHPAIAANPYLAFPLRATVSGTLAVSWLGDNGFSHSQSVALSVTA